MLCLQFLPSILPSVPGSKSRFDDFAATHINLTLSIHLDGLFLPWHRNFVWLYEKALREECGFTGSQPYWNWPLWASNLSSSPLFDGSDTSLSGDGAKLVDPQNYTLGPGVSLPHGTGGGCVLDGPFVNHSMNLGPFEYALAFEGILPSNWSAYNPHCLIRDLNNYISTRYQNQTAVDDLLASETIVEFQERLNGVGADLGVHAGGHFALGLGLQDFFASPLDPAFYLHHGAIDWVWWLWQNGGEEGERVWALNGTDRIFNPPGSEEVTLSTVANWGVLGGEKMVGEVMRVYGGEFCYGYE